MSKAKGRTPQKLSQALVGEWHATRNYGLVPQDVSAHTHRKVWWVCGTGHEWEAAIYSRTAGSGCPYCSQRRVGYGNDLATKYPDLAAQWHTKKNADLKPHLVLPRSNRKAWWLGVCGHEWEAVIANRTGPFRSGCPFCTNQKLGYGNDLVTRFPSIALQWHPSRNGRLTADQVTSGSSRKVWWQCADKHEWQAQVYKRTAESQDCERCGLVGLSILEIQIFAELQYVLADHLEPCVYDHRISATAGGGQKLRIDMVFGRIAVEFDGSYWHAEKIERDLLKTERLHELGYTVVRLREHPLETVGPFDVKVPRATTALQGAVAVLDQLVSHGLLAPEAEKDANRYLWDGEIKARASARRRIEALRSREYGERSLAFNHPIVASQWHPSLNGKLTPGGVTSSSARKVWWLCPNGHKYEAKIDQRTGKGTGCGTCSGRYSTPETSLAAIKPALAAQWHPTLNGSLTPEDLGPHSHKVVWWLCPQGHAATDKVSDRAKGIVCQDCPHSRRRRRRKSVNPGT